MVERLLWAMVHHGRKKYWEDEGAVCSVTWYVIHLVNGIKCCVGPMHLFQIAVCECGSDVVEDEPGAYFYQRILLREMRGSRL